MLAIRFNGKSLHTATSIYRRIHSCYRSKSQQINQRKKSANLQVMGCGLELSSTSSL